MSTIVTLQAAPASELTDFVTLSAILTGIAANMLQPHFDRYQMAQQYLNVCKTNAPTSYAALMAVYQANSTQPPDTIAQAVLQPAGSDVSNMAKSVMLLWYLACWYDPNSYASLQQNPPQPPQFTVVSADAYTQSWVWRVGQTHPMGYSTWRFGYWHEAPQPLSAFIGGTGS